jgi:hypothetical protein
MKKRYIKHLKIVLIILNIISAALVLATEDDWTWVAFIICIIVSFVAFLVEEDITY